MPTITLPGLHRTLERFTTKPPQPFPLARPPFSRVAYAAAHVVADPLADTDPWIHSAIDWDATLDYRHYLWSLGLGVAEAMDTAQRGSGLDWPASIELIRRSVAAAPPGGLIVCGAGTDHLPPNATIQQVIGGYEAQCESIEKVGGRIVLMASRALAAVARSPDDYQWVYGKILTQLRHPVILHWLGDRFDPALANYWGHASLDAATATCLDIINAHPAKVDGLKLSLLDANREVALRRHLPRGVRLYTGDDFHYPDLIAGDDEGYSHALLGIFDPIAPAAAAALAHLQRGDLDAYHDALRPTVPLARHMFRAPTQFYKTGIVFMAYLNGHQPHFAMIGGQQSARSLLHLAELFRLADGAGLLRDPDDACLRMARVLAVHGL